MRCDKCGTELLNGRERGQNCIYEHTHFRCISVQLAARDAELDKARAVVEAARDRLNVWTRETYVAVADALKAYDTALAAIGEPGGKDGA